MLSGRSIEAHKSDCPVLPTEIYVIVAWRIAYTAQTQVAWVHPPSKVLFFFILRNNFPFWELFG